MHSEPYLVNPDDPRAPPQEVWDRLSPQERARLVERLPSEFPYSEAQPPEGDPHFEAKTRAHEVLDSFFSRMGRKVYLACELPVYYPGEPHFAPDVMAVMDTETHSRMRWVVSDERRGLDLALEVRVAGDARKDLERNVERYARLGIREYFLFDWGRRKLNGWRLTEPSRRTYSPILPQHGFYRSEVLGLELQLEGERLRFYMAGAPLPENRERIATLEQFVVEAEKNRNVEAQLRVALEQQLAETARLRAEEARPYAEEQQRREQVERQLAEALAELERMRGNKKEVGTASLATP